MGEKYVAMKLKDQARALAIIDGDPGLHALKTLQGPLLDLEIRGPAPLHYFGDTLWGPIFDEMAASASDFHPEQLEHASLLQFRMLAAPRLC